MDLLDKKSRDGSSKKKKPLIYYSFCVLSIIKVYFYPINMIDHTELTFKLFKK